MGLVLANALAGVGTTAPFAVPMDQVAKGDCLDMKLVTETIDPAVLTPMPRPLLLYTPSGFTDVSAKEVFASPGAVATPPLEQVRAQVRHLLDVDGNVPIRFPYDGGLSLFVPAGYSGRCAYTYTLQGGEERDWGEATGACAPNSFHEQRRGELIDFPGSTDKKGRTYQLTQFPAAGTTSLTILASTYPWGARRLRARAPAGAVIAVTYRYGNAAGTIVTNEMAGDWFSVGNASGIDVRTTVPFLLEWEIDLGAA